MASRKMTRHGANATNRRASTRGARRSPVSGSAPASRTRSTSAARKRDVPSDSPARRRAKPQRAAKTQRAKRQQAATPTRARTVRTNAARRVAAPRFLARLPRGVLVSLVVAAVIALSIWSFYPVARVEYREERQKSKLEAELTALKQRNVRLSKEVARLRTPEGVEDAARANLGLVKEGEHAVVVVDPTRDTTIAAAPSIDSEPKVSAPRGPWTAALDAFFGYHE